MGKRGWRGREVGERVRGAWEQGNRTYPEGPGISSEDGGACGKEVSREGNQWTWWGSVLQTG